MERGGIAQNFGGSLDSIKKEKRYKASKNLKEANRKKEVRRERRHEIADITYAGS